MYIIRSLNGRGTNGEPLYVGYKDSMTSFIGEAQLFTVSCFKKNSNGECNTFDEKFSNSYGESLEPKIKVDDIKRNLILFTSFATTGPIKGLIYNLLYIDFNRNQNDPHFYVDTTNNNGPITTIDKSKEQDFLKSYVEKVYS